LQDLYVKGATDTSYLPRVYPNGFGIPELSPSHVLVLQGVAAALEINRTLRLQRKQNGEREGAWDFVIQSEDKEESTPIKVTETAGGLSVSLITGFHLQQLYF